MSDKVINEMQCSIRRQSAQQSNLGKLFHTDLKYTDRESKAAYVYSKYRRLLAGSVLDVGADAAYLRPYITAGSGKYVGIGFGDKVDISINLETSPLPFENQSFDTVLCLDTLEHLEAAHFMFAELCRVAKRCVIISLPNPWGVLMSHLRRGDYSPTTRMKFYGLPPEPPEDRHRWFFSEAEAKQFLRYNAQKSGFDILQLDSEHDGSPMAGNGLRGAVARLVLSWLFRPDMAELGLHHGPLWCVLERKG